jgi:peptide deformylase
MRDDVIVVSSVSCIYGLGSPKEYRNKIIPIIKNKNSEHSIYEEGCLSVPNQFAEVNRPSSCEVEYLDYNGNKKILKASGLLATCIQHEMDHLEGILFIDYLSKLKKMMIVKKLSKQKNKVDRIVV